MKSVSINSKKVVLEPIDNKKLINLCGPLDSNIKELEQKLKIIINRYNNIFQIIGNLTSVDTAIEILTSLYSNININSKNIKTIGIEEIHLAIKKNQIFKKNELIPINCDSIKDIHQEINLIKPKTTNQKQYINNIFNKDIIFGIGPSGTGKTYLAVGMAMQALRNKNIDKILLTRPAVETGEKLGFLPGDLNQKIYPYLYPLYDALFKIIGKQETNKLIERNIIEISPLAYMRGRTLNHTIMLLDEGQNTTISQMKMFLTRLGFDSKAIITGDITQIDLPKYQESGLCNAMKILSKIKNISFNFFDKEDIIRHPIITNIIDAYETWKKTKNN